MADGGGPGVGDIQPIAAGTSAQPLVPTIQPVVTGDAVDRLVNAFRTGALNTQDVIDRVGAVAQAANKSKLEALQEYVSPEAIQSRMAAYRAAGAQSDLASLQAHAASGLVGPQSTAAREAIIRQQEDINQKEAIDSWNRWNLPVYKTDEEGNPTNQYDYDAMAQGGIEYSRAEKALAFAQQGLKGEWINRPDPKTGQPMRVMINGQGEDITPGSSGRKFYEGMRQDAWTRIYSPPKNQPSGGQRTAAPSAAVTPTTAPAAAPAVTAADISPAQSADLANDLEKEGFPNSGAMVSGMTPQERVEAYNQRNAPTIQPTTPAASAYTEMTGLPAGPVPGTTPPEMRKQLQEDKSIDAWQQAQATYQKFAESAKEANPDSVSDLNLAENFSKILDPNSTLREFKFAALKDAIPWLSYLSKDGVDIIERNKRFPDEVRKKIIEDGFKNIDAADRAVAPAFDRAEKIAPGTLTAREKAARDAVPFKQQVGIDTTPQTTSSASRPAGIPTNAVWQPNIRGGVWATPDGRFWK